MNAYELADQVEMWGEDLLALNMKGGVPVIEGAKMLRQQAKELDEAGHMIGVLREYISDLENGLDSSIKLNKAQAERNNEPVAWIELDVIPLTHIIKAVVRREQDEQYSIPLYTHPVKELTDEEIRTIQAICHLKDVGYDNFIMRFARAILRKVQEK